MLDDRNRQLAEVSRADDFIVSDKLVSEIYLRPVEEYVAAGTPDDFYTVVEGARRRCEAAIGYRVAPDARISERDNGVVLNPRKSVMRTFAPGDRVIVLAND